MAQTFNIKNSAYDNTTKSTFFADTSFFPYNPHLLLQTVTMHITIVTVFLNMQAVTLGSNSSTVTHHIIF